MNMHLVAFLVGLVTLAKADVSHLKQASFASNSLDDVAIRFNSAGNAQNARYWWQNTQTSPFTKTAQQQHISHEQNHIQNPHFNVKTQHHPSQQRSNAYANMATLSGSPSEVNSLTHDTAQQTNYIADQYRPFVPKIPCYGATQVCAPKAACQHGFISESDLGLVQSQANNCDSQLEACCNIEVDVPVQDDQLASCSDANSACVASKFCFNGFMDQSVEHKAVRSPTCVAPAVCCRFSDRKRAAPSFQDSDYAAASTSEVLTKEGYVVNVPSNQYLPSFPEPSQPEYNPDSSNDDPSKLRPETPRPQQPQPTPAPRPKCSNGAPDSAYPDCCANGGRGQYCCQNGANNPDCCANPNGRGRYCCDNGLDTPDCKAPNVPGPQPNIPQPTYTPAPQQPTIRPTPPPVRVVPTTQRPYVPQPSNPQPSVQFQDQATNIVPSACPAAMNCTLIEYCDAIATISKTPVQLNDFQKNFRVPMTDCMIMPSRELGKCCRDPDYTDPWPIGRFGQYNADELNAVFDSGAYKPEGQKAASTNRVNVRVAAPSNQQRVVQQQTRPYRAIANSVQPAINKPFQPQPSQPIQPVQTCGVRNYNTQPRGKAPLGTGFGEFTWVAMVILESKKALLCGGSIVDKNVVVTSADCVQGHRHNDVLIKAGEWRLGSDEEPKPFQIVRVQRIVSHPQFNPQTLDHNIAILYLENDIKYDTHIGPICLDDSAPSASDNCVTTGWSKEVLKVHLGNALMQHTRVSVLPQADCQSRLDSSRLGYKDSNVCGVTEQDACQVDPGSALACADQSGRYSLKGVYSTDTGCNEPNQVVAYTRTDLQWINEFLRNSARAY